MRDQHQLPTRPHPSPSTHHDDDHHHHQRLIEDAFEALEEDEKMSEVNTKVHPMLGFSWPHRGLC